jgi:hypothetical protein
MSKTGLMTNLSSVSPTAHHQLSSSNHGAPAESAAAGGGGFSMQDLPGGDKSYSAMMLCLLPQSAKDSSSFCPFTAGHYTEF